MKKIIILFIVLLGSLSGYAGSTIRGGEISYKAVTDGRINTYDITITLYSNSNNGQDGLNQLLGTNGNDGPLFLGDGQTITMLNRDNGPNNSGEIVSPGIRKNTYNVTHTYADKGSYVISLIINGRNQFIINIIGQTHFYLDALLTIGIGPMNSPQLTFPPFDNACLHYPYRMNPGAIDPDGDELRIKLVRCMDLDPGDTTLFQYPNEMDPNTIFTINPWTWVFTWNRPLNFGEYHFAFKISKYRNGVLVGWVIREMEISVINDNDGNIPPVLDPIPDICVLAGTPITFKITSHDDDYDDLKFETTGLPYQITPNPATYKPDKMPKGKTSGTFTWNTKPSNLTKNVYRINYRVTDTHPGAPSLSDVNSSLITLITPPVNNVFATQHQRGFYVRWDKTIMPNATGYNIYRMEGPITAKFDSCTMFFNPGFTLAGSVSGENTLTFFDNNFGKGLASGFTYCYVVTAVFDGGAESAPSTPYCTPLLIPFIKVIHDTLTQCVGNTVVMDSSIIVFESADPRTRYKWATTPSLKITSAGTQVPGIKMITPGFTAVKIVANSGVYTDSATLWFNVRPIPTPVIKAVDLGGIPDSVLFFNRSENDVSAEWLLPNGTASTNMDSVLCTFEKNGYYRVKLKVYNNLGCPDTMSMLYRVLMKGIAFPNAFEPGNPSTLLNTFKPKGLGLKTFYLGIWDLWGNLIWSTTQVNKDTEPAHGWDGKNKKGEMMPAQNYIWRMSATFLDGKEWMGIKDHFGNCHKEGTFTLLR